MGKFLTTEQERELLRELRLEKSRRYADRIRVILLLNQGETYKNISKFLFLDEGTIANYRKRYKEGGLEGLIIDDYLAKNFLLSDEQLLELSLHLEANIYLSVKEITAHIEVTYGVQYSISGATKLLKKMGFTYKKTKPVPGKASREKQELFIEEYKKLKQKLQELDGKIYFCDSTHPYHNPVISYGWVKVGEDFEIKTNSGRSHLNINGAVDIESMEVVTSISDTVNADAICDLLKSIRSLNSLPLAEVYLILDNAPYNRSKKVKTLANELNISLVYLPSYSPNLNPIERLWKFFKKKTLYNQYYELEQDFKAACLNFFQNIDQYRKELKSLLTDNFQIVGA